VKASRPFEEFQASVIAVYREIWPDMKTVDMAVIGDMPGAKQ
jgi:hypothetical protein